MVGPGTDTLFHERDPGAPVVAADGSVLEMDEHLMVIDDNYTGVVAQGSPPQRRTIPGATITKMSVGPMDKNETSGLGSRQANERSRVDGFAAGRGIDSGLAKSALRGDG